MPPILHHRIVELRQYTLHPGQRDTLIALFEREFVEAQEAVGIAVLGQFRDLDDPDRFVWLRGFASMAQRAPALAAFYDGPVWRAHREAANATMVDSDNVLLLRPACDTPLPTGAGRRDPNAAASASVVAVVSALPAAADAASVGALDAALAPAIAQARGRSAACLVTEAAANNFPRLPVREGESVIVWLVGFDTPDAGARFAADAARLLGAPTQVLRLAPTAHSRF